MGKGDKKTKRGKINLGSHGRLRPTNKKMELRNKKSKDSEEKGA